MNAPSHHHIHRHRAAPWLEMRVSTGSADCYRPHSHTQYSVGIVDAGQAVFHHPDGPDRVQRGTVVLIEPGVLHACNPHAGHTWSYRMLFLDAQWFADAMSARVRDGHSPMPLFNTRTVSDPHLLDRLAQCLTLPLAAHTLAAELPGMLAPYLQPAGMEQAVTYPATLQPAMQRMAADPGAPWRVHDMAQACGLSASLFIRRFKQAMGCTPGRYLTNARLDGARRLIAQGVPLAEVAHAMGFADQPHLQRAFKAHHAMTPGRYASTASRLPACGALPGR